MRPWCNKLTMLLALFPIKSNANLRGLRDLAGLSPQNETVTVYSDRFVLRYMLLSYDGAGVFHQAHAFAGAAVGLFMSFRWKAGFHGVPSAGSKNRSKPQ